MDHLSLSVMCSPLSYVDRTQRVAHRSYTLPRLEIHSLIWSDRDCQREGERAWGVYYMWVHMHARLGDGVCRRVCLWGFVCGRWQSVPVQVWVSWRHCQEGLIFTFPIHVSIPVIQLTPEMRYLVILRHRSKKRWAGNSQAPTLNSLEKREVTDRDLSTHRHRHKHWAANSILFKVCSP